MYEPVVPAFDDPVAEQVRNTTRFTTDVKQIIWIHSGSLSMNLVSWLTPLETATQ
jgi:hypothetical protein